MKKTMAKGPLFNYLGHFRKQKFLDQGHNDLKSTAISILDFLGPGAESFANGLDPGSLVGRKEEEERRKANEGFSNKSKRSKQDLAP